MKVMIDIGHPAHVHYFRNIIASLVSVGVETLVIARKKEVSQDLLRAHGISFVDRGTGGSGFFQKCIYLVLANWMIIKEARIFKPDLFVSFCAPYAAQAAFVLRKPYIGITDTEHATLGNLAFAPFSQLVYTPECYEGSFGKKHRRFDSYMELCYLHPNYFTPDPSILFDLGLSEGERYAVIRFVSWEATHDRGHNGISHSNKLKIVKEFKKLARVFISSEGPLPAELESLRLHTEPEKIHHVLSFASLLFGESATMASEAAVLGTPAVYLDNSGRGYTNEQESKYGIVSNFTESEEDQKKSIAKGVEILADENSKARALTARGKILREKIDPTAFLTQAILNAGNSSV